MTRIAIASHPNAQMAAVFGLRDLLKSANLYVDATTKQTQPLQVEVVDSFDLEDSPTFDVIILPPCLDGALEPNALPHLICWIDRQHAKGALTCSVCVGAFLLAEAGLLEGRSATTHWGLEDQFKARFPEVRLQTDRLIIDDGDIITAGGLMAWTDLGLRLIARFLSPPIMQQTAKLFLIDPGHRDQSYYHLFSPKLTHGDTQILKAQRWVQTQFATAIGIPDIAAAAGMESRTFHRRFRNATGHTPSDYLQRLRIQKACELLETSATTIDHIAGNVGYLDVPSFGKLFKKTIGLSPGEYRKRFTAVKL
jgi:transcriptional regulator GlxA family with amidase domain